MIQIPLWTKKWLEARNIPLLFLEETTSTNSLAKELAASTPHSLHVVVAAQQTQGRGQKQNTWENSDLMMSWLFKKVSCPIHEHLAQDLSLHFLSAAQKTWQHLPWAFKKPNDILLDQKKVAGLLVEVLEDSQKDLIVGVGFNVLSHPPGLPSADHLQTYTSDITFKKWESFLNELHSLWLAQLLASK